jgi:hypothetical protein
MKNLKIHSGHRYAGELHISRMAGAQRLSPEQAYVEGLVKL